MKHGRRVRVWKATPGVWMWECRNEGCHAPDDRFRQGASIHWEIAQLQADDHAHEWHKRERHVARDMGTPPGGTRFDWSDSGMHVAIPHPRSST